MIYHNVFLIFFFVFIEFFYLEIARRFRIFDIPNVRSLHNKTTIRGLGIVFLFAVLSYSLVWGFHSFFFVIGLLLVSIVSFIDDVRPLPNRYRIVTHIFGIGLIGYQIYLLYPSIPIVSYFIILIFGVGIINSFNFMDGINGITGFYSLISIGTLYYVDNNIDDFVDEIFLIELGLSVVVFLYFNFRKKALGFCGDVGSIGIGFIIFFIVVNLILKTQNLKYIFFLGVYGIDTIYTLLYRLQKGENIFKAHKAHLFQLLVNEYNISHLIVSFFYGIIQLALNILIIYFNLSSIYFCIPFFFLLVGVHVLRSIKGQAIKVVLLSK